jgi:uncharacterized protein (TIGR02246 family)
VTISIEDRVSIHDLYARWCVTIDDGDAESWADTFTDDAVFRLTTHPVRAEGREEILAMGRSVYEHDEGMNRHQCHNILLTEEDDAVVGRCDAVVLELRTGGDARIIKTCRYHDRVVKIDRGWAFAERVIVWDTPHIPVQPEVEGREAFMAEA